MGKKVEIEIGGGKLAVFNREKVLYPKVGFTKGQVIDYYIRIAPVLLPHLKNRPITLKRHSEGIDGFFFYEKQCASHRPTWVKTTEVPSRRAAGKIDYCMILQASVIQRGILQTQAKPKSGKVVTKTRATRRQKAA
jgi:bifunctional non-homologous end joining protein LigD